MTGKKSKTNLTVETKGKEQLKSIKVNKIRDAVFSPLRNLGITFVRSRLFNAAFLGRFKFGTKEDMINLGKLMGVQSTSSITPNTAVLVVDDLKRTNSVTLDKARSFGILVLSEEEFLTLLSNPNKLGEIKYHEQD